MLDNTNTSVVQKAPFLSWALLANTFACGLAANHYYGIKAAASCMLVNVALARLNPRHSQEFWFALNRETLEDLKTTRNFVVLLPLTFIAPLIAKRWQLPIHQEAIKWMRYSLAHSQALALRAIFEACIVAPLVEETLFRGFLQEKIRDVQCCLVQNESSSVQETLRLSIQAIVFAIMHYAPSQGRSNIPILIVTGLGGMMLGTLKESSLTLCNSTIVHALINSSMTIKVWMSL